MHHKNTGIEYPSNPVLLRFLGFLFVGGTLTQIAAVRAGVRDHGTGWLLLTMWTPALAAFTASRATRQMAWASLQAAKLPLVGSRTVGRLGTRSAQSGDPGG